MDRTETQNQPENQKNRPESKHVEIDLLGEFAVRIDGHRVDQLISRSYKGVLLLQILMIHLGDMVPNNRLWTALWPDDEKHANPESALKTLVSRMRTVLRSVHPLLADCLVTEQGGYSWQCRPGVSIDVMDVEQTLRQIAVVPPLEAVKSGLCDRLLGQYKGELLKGDESNVLIHTLAAQLHKAYLTALGRCVEALNGVRMYEQVAAITGRILEVEKLTEEIYMDRMKALVRIGRLGDAVSCFRQMERVFFQALGVRPSEEMQEFYRNITGAVRMVHLNMDAIRGELEQQDNPDGAYVCDYVVFKEGFNILMRNVDRTLCSVCLAALCINRADGAEMSPDELDSVMSRVTGMMRGAMARGDIVTRYALNIITVLMPVTTLPQAEERLGRAQREFYRQFAKSGLLMDYRVQILPPNPR